MYVAAQHESIANTVEIDNLLFSNSERNRKSIHTTLVMSFKPWAPAIRAGFGQLLNSVLNGQCSNP